MALVPINSGDSTKKGRIYMKYKMLKRSYQITFDIFMKNEYLKKLRENMNLIGYLA
jgi:hypothetical protein